MQSGFAATIGEERVEITYEDLRICAALSREAEDLKEQGERLRSALEGGVARIGIAQGRRNTRILDGMPEMVAALIELDQMYIDRYSKYVRHVKAIERVIETIESPDQRRIVRMRYIHGMTWDKIAEKLHMDERWCRRLANNALKKLNIRK